MRALADDALAASATLPLGSSNYLSHATGQGTRSFDEAKSAARKRTRYTFPPSPTSYPRGPTGGPTPAPRPGRTRSSPQPGRLLSYCIALLPCWAFSWLAVRITHGSAQQQ